MTKRIEIPKPNAGYGYVGVWHDGTLGWWLPEHLSGGRDREEPNREVLSHIDAFGKPERVFLCRITLKPLLDRKGRPITRIVKPRE